MGIDYLDWDGASHRTDDSDEYETLEEAIAAAMADLQPGGTLTIHGEDCSVEEDGETGCDCDALVLRKGAQS
jgi:hypothetical protein